MATPREYLRQMEKRLTAERERRQGPYVRSTTSERDRGPRVPNVMTAKTELEAPLPRKPIRMVRRGGRLRPATDETIATPEWDKPAARDAIRQWQLIHGTMREPEPEILPPQGSSLTDVGRIFRSAMAKRAGAPGLEPREPGYPGGKKDIPGRLARFAGATAGEAIRPGTMAAGVLLPGLARGAGKLIGKIPGVKEASERVATKLASRTRFRGIKPAFPTRPAARRPSIHDTDELDRSLRDVVGLKMSRAKGKVMGMISGERGVSGSLRPVPKTVGEALARRRARAEVRRTPEKFYRGAKPPLEIKKPSFPVTEEIRRRRVPYMMP